MGTDGYFEQPDKVLRPFAAEQKRLEGLYARYLTLFTEEKREQSGEPFHDSDWFRGTGGRFYEYQYNIDAGQHEWTEIFHVDRLPPQGSEIDPFRSHRVVINQDPEGG
jgi:hypothetical protein